MLLGLSVYLCVRDVHVCMYQGRGIPDWSAVDFLFFISCLLILVLCGRLSWLSVIFWVHVNLSLCVVSWTSVVCRVLLLLHSLSLVWLCRSFLTTFPTCSAATLLSAWDWHTYCTGLAGAVSVRCSPCCPVPRPRRHSRFPAGCVNDVCTRTHHTIPHLLWPAAAVARLCYSWWSSGLQFAFSWDNIKSLNYAWILLKMTFFEFPKVKWLHLTGEMDKSVTCVKFTQDLTCQNH